MSIKPEFASLIFAGEKGYEYRKVLFRNPAVTTIVVYASSPIQKVIGEFEVEHILSLSPDKLWKATSRKAGITRAYFMAYFIEKEVGHAIKIGKTKLYRTPKCLHNDFGMIPPQSFAYLK